MLTKLTTQPIKPKTTSLCAHCENCEKPLEFCANFDRQTRNENDYILTVQCSGYRKQATEHIAV